MPTTGQRAFEIIALVVTGAVVGDVFGTSAALVYVVGLGVLFVTGWWKKPVAMIGAISVAYHEVIRDRRTGICQNCGKLHDAVIKQCPKCGGEVEENAHPDEVLSDSGGDSV